MKILIICTGNSCRSPIAQGFLKSFDQDLEIASAGTKPELKVNPFAIQVMKESFIDISNHVPTAVETYLNNDFDFVVTVCENSNSVCPTFNGKIKNRLHIGFDDPADATGTDQEKLKVYRQTRDNIKNEIFKFYKQYLNK
ncbi:MAG: arsenate reductase ArsC [Bacteroidales bacterium]|nr:arsenate reductase ArsC [Bacteroidales bacterium]